MGDTKPGLAGRDRASGTRPRRRTTLIVVSALFLAGCLLAGEASAETLVNSNITTNTTWTTTGSPYVIQKGISVKAGATLKLEPGVTVAFNGQYRLTAEGSINAVGTAASPITFTSTAALSGSGAPGQYGGVTVSAASSVFSYTHFLYGAKGTGGFYAYAVLKIAGGSATVAHSVFEHNEYTGLGVTSEGAASVSYTTFASNGDGISDVGGSKPLEVTHSTMRNNSYGLYFDLTRIGPAMYYNSITENSAAGVRVGQNCEEAQSAFAHGEYNNIFANGPAETGGRQLNALYVCKALPVSWRNNYWGSGVYYYYNDGRCASSTTPYLGHLAYTWSKPAKTWQVPVGPISSGSTAHIEGPKESEDFGCGWDVFNIGPGGFLTSSVPNAGASPESGSPEPTAPTFYGGSSEAAPNLNSVSCGDPVNCVTGDFFEVYTDLHVPGLNTGLSFRRTYNSQAAAAGTHGPLGYGWSFEFGESLSLDPSSESATVTNADGSQVTFTKIGETFTVPAWVQATLKHNGEGTYSYTLPNQRVFVFSSAGRLEKVQDRNGNTTTLAYSEAGRLETATDPGGRKLTFAYNGEGLIESVKDPMGRVVKYAYEGGNLASVTLPGEEVPRWAFKYDAAHEITTVTDGRGGKTTNEYDSSLRVVKQTDPLKRTTKWVYTTGDTKVTTPNSSVLDIQYSYNLPTQLTRAYGTVSAATTKYGYDAADNLISITDPLEHVIKYGYDSEGNRTSVVDPDEHESKWTYDGTHDVLTATAPSGEKTTVERDAHGNATSVSRPAPASTTQVTKFKYDAHGNLEAVTDPLEHSWKYEYDGYGDRTGEIDPESDKRTRAYDEDSFETSTVSPRGNVEGGEPAKFTTKTERDAQERPLTVTDPLGHKTKYTYDADGKLETQTDASSHATTYTYDGDNERTRVEEPNKGISETGYDAAGRVTSQTDGNKHTTTYVRNILEQVTEAVDPLGRRTTKEYDAAGRLKTLTDAAKRTTTYKYDPAGRLTERSYSDGVTPTVKLEYDANGDRIKMTDGTGTTKDTFDQLDRLTERKDGHGDVSAYEYNLADQQTKTTYPNGKTVTTAYDSAGRVKSVTDWLEHTTKFAYNADGEPTATTYPSGTSNEDTYAYDETDRMHEAKMSKGAEVLASLVYERDNLGQVSKTTSKGLPGAEVTSYGYDPNSRLVEAGSAAYEYDAANNAAKTPGSTNTYDAASELEKGTGVSYSYDEMGERTKTAPGTGPATTYGYDQAGNLTAVTRAHEGEVPAIEDSYAYDGDGLRASQTVAGSTAYLTWNPTEGLPLILSDGAYSYVYGPGDTPVEQISSGGTVTYLHHDQQGSTRLLTGSTGTVAGTTTYDAYGDKTGSTGASTTPLGYDGQYTDSDTGLIYLRARAYDPATSQLLTRDPLVSVTGEAYVYAGDNPTNFTDPSGLIFGIAGTPSFSQVGSTIVGGITAGANSVGGALNDGLKALASVGHYVAPTLDAITWGTCVAAPELCLTALGINFLAQQALAADQAIYISNYPLGLNEAVIGTTTFLGLLGAGATDFSNLTGLQRALLSSGITYPQLFVDLLEPGSVAQAAMIRCQ